MKRIHQSFFGIVSVAVVLTVTASPAQEAKIAVLNPRGALPPIRLVPMAPRANTLEGKTVYFEVIF